MPKSKIKQGLEKINTWRKGSFYYEGITLRSILDEIERRFNTRIICQPAGLADQLYTGYIIITHLDSALMSICWPLRIQYEHRDIGVVLSRT